MGKSKAGNVGHLPRLSAFSPEIDGEKCLLAVSAVSRCDACAVACPAGAILCDEEGIGIDEERCIGCGLCAPACPEQAIGTVFKPKLKDIAGRKAIFAACTPALEGAAEAEKQAGVPCLHALGLRELMAARHLGADLLIFARGDCRTCIERRGRSIEQTVALAVLMCESRDERFPEARMVNFAEWRMLHAKAQPCRPGRAMDRRGLLRLFTTPVEVALGQSQPVTGAYGFTKKSSEDVVVWVPRIAPATCSGCDACARICPHDAILLQQDDGGDVTGYLADPAECTGCRLCVDICQENAISLSSPGLAQQQRVALTSVRCSVCGVPFHYPADPKKHEHSCRVCAKVGAAKKLFHVHRQQE